MIGRRRDVQGTRWRRLGAAAIALAACGPAWGQQADGGSPLSTLNRLLRVFDFEEAETAPRTMPINFYRHVAPDRGFPSFGSLALTDEVSYRGRWSFAFSLDGGSMSARVPTAVLPVLPNSDYTVSVWVRTAGLDDGRAGLVAELHDIQGMPVPGTRVESELVRTRGAWRQLSVHVHGDDDRAADLVVELQVLQPSQYLDPGARGDRPLLEDVDGRAWFDDLAIWQRPRLEMTTGAPGNVIGPDEPRTLHVLIRDPTRDRLDATLTIRDLTGSTARELRFQPAHGAWQRTVALDDLPGGWYLAELRVRALEQDAAVRGQHASRLIHDRRLELVICPPGPRRRATSGHLGVALPAAAAADPATAVELVRRLGAETALVELALPKPGEERVISPVSSDGLVEGLLAAGIEVSLGMPRLPDPVARQAGVSPADVLGLLDGGGERSRGLIRSLGSGTTMRVSHWLLGTPGGADPPTAARLAPGAQRSLGDFVPAPVVLVPAAIDDGLVPLPAPHRYWVDVPFEARAETIEAVAAQWASAEGAPVFGATLERLPAGAYTPLERVADLMRRALAGFRAGLDRMTIEAPWRSAPRGPVTPAPEFAAWRVLAEALPGRTFGGEIPLGPGLRAWILDGGGADDALVVWNESAPEPVTVPVLLADDHVRRIDAAGNQGTIPLAGGVHHLPVTRLPAFIEGIDGDLARFRAGFAIDPPFIPARRRVHEARIVLANPWARPIHGTISLEPDAACRLTPRVRQFAIGPGERAEIPVEFVFGRVMASGPADIAATVDLQGDPCGAITLRTSILIGLEGLGVTAFWRAAGDDIVVGVNVTNLGDRVEDLYCQIIGPGIGHHRRPIAGLLPGQTVLRTFLLGGATEPLAGRALNVTIGEADGDGRVTQVLEINPAAATSPTPATASGR